MRINKKSISSTSYSSAASTYGKAQKVTGSIQDSVEVSESGSLFQTTVDLARNTSDIRTEAVEGIQQELEQGNYQRNEFEVAGKVIQDQLNLPVPA